MRRGELFDFDILASKLAGATTGVAAAAVAAAGGTGAVAGGRPAGRHARPAMKVATDTVLALAPDLFLSGRAYVLKVKARGLDAGDAGTVGVRFRGRVASETYRTYAIPIGSGDFTVRELSFTAPIFASRPELTIVTNGRPVMIEELSLTMREALVQTEPIGSLEGSYAPEGYALVFNDEFNGSSLNRAKWFTRYVYESESLDHLKGERQRYRDNANHVLAGGVLSLVARRAPGAPSGAEYESAAIRSDWTTRYGYFEARVKMPGGRGVFPAFWLNPDADEKGELTWPPEIDIFELVNNDHEEKVNMLHTGVVGPAGTDREFRYVDPAFDTKWRFWRAPFDFDAGWHTVGAEWTADTVTTYVDGKRVVAFGHQWKHKDGTLAPPAHILLNLAIGGDWAGRHGIDDAAFPQALQVDWVRAYKKVGQ